MKFLYIFISAAAVSAVPFSPLSPRQFFRPTVKRAELLGIADDPRFHRDSCSCARFGDRALWTCRDSQRTDIGKPIQDSAVISSTASWSDFALGSPAIQNNVLPLYGDIDGLAYFPIQPDSCPNDEAGQCADFTRFAIWPNTSPLVAKAAPDGSVAAYTWIRKQHINRQLAPVGANDTATTLYRMDYSPSDPRNALPRVTVVDGNFWAEGQIPYGNYGNVLVNGVAYLYGRPSNGLVAVARVPAGSIEDKGQWEYFVDGAWSKEVPTMYNPWANIPNASAGGEGTYYYSRAWRRFVWIGQDGGSTGAQFWITTSQTPEGPWEEPFMFHEAQTGSYGLGAYSLAANAALVGEANEIYLTYTKNDYIPDGSGNTWYSTPLIRIEWE